ncbi:flagellin FliC, partial [Salmonella enterica subsp. diarizonae]|nr:flagellin FliC [Salmonella enterica subsp. diarizonae]EFS9643357.1 flagellin FliC [Salmonella enterica]ECG1308611.1 flagellin FliC [Salmonella enterica subsp. diarizonae]ECI4405099.1 flagellin FliC [Salmonella enterica subsp. diarizonae]EDQ1112523.1 flagellin FliC [Salmonella enterica subsp. diarizonae]
NTLTIQVGANDGETIDIDLKQINSQTLGLDTLNVQKAYDVDSKAVTPPAKLDIAGLTGTAIKTGVDSATVDTGSIKDGKVYYNSTSKNYYVEVDFGTSADAAKSGYYKVNVADDGTVSMTASTTKEATTPTGITEVTQVQKPVAAPAAIQAQLTAAHVTGADTAEMVKMSYTDKNGKTIDGGYAVKVGDDYYAATQKKDGSFSINTTSYTAADGTSKTALNQLGGADGKTEVVTIDGKTYNASKAAGHDFKAQPELAEAAAKTTENPLQKIDAALAQVDTLRSDLGAVQNRFNSAITNLGNTVNNLTSARSRIEDSDYATEVSNMSRAQILQQAGTSVLAQANQVPQNVLSLLR